MVSAVAVGWSGYAAGFLKSIGLGLPDVLVQGPELGGVLNLPAIFIIWVVAGLLIAGTRESATLNAILVLIKIAALALFIAVALPVFDAANFEPFMPYGFPKSGPAGKRGRRHGGGGDHLFRLLRLRRHRHCCRGSQEPEPRPGDRDRRIDAGLRGDLYGGGGGSDRRGRHHRLCRQRRAAGADPARDRPALGCASPGRVGGHRAADGHPRLLLRTEPDLLHRRARRLAAGQPGARLAARDAGADHDLHRHRHFGLRRSHPADGDRGARQCRDACGFCRGLRGDARPAPPRAECRAQVPRAGGLAGRHHRHRGLHLSVRQPAQPDADCSSSPLRRSDCCSTRSTAAGRRSGRACECMTERRLTNIIGGSAGNLVEWFDWYVYAAFALYFAPRLLPRGRPDRAAPADCGDIRCGLPRPADRRLADGHLCRSQGPQGGADAVGVADVRGSLLIAVAPTYAQVGLLSPAILLIARLLQGLSLGGEYGSSATYLSEIADRERRGFWSSFQYVTIIGGQLTALALLVTLQALLGEQAMQDWGWRMGFGAGAVLAVVVFFIRRRLDETSSFENVAGRVDRPQSTARSLFREHPRQAFLVMALTAGGTAAFYAYTIYLQKFLVNTSGFDRATASQIMTVALTIMLLIQPLAGRLSDRVGRKPLMIFFGTSAMLFTYPIFATLEDTRSDARRIRPGHGLPDHGHRLFVNQRHHQGGDVPGAHPRAGRRAALCHRQCDFRGQRRICRSVPQGYRP